MKYSKILIFFAAMAVILASPPQLRADSGDGSATALTSALDAGVTTPDSQLAALLDGEWMITAVGRKKINGDENIPYIYFEPSRGRFYCSNGCNIINGNYKVADGGMVAFTDIIASSEQCATDKYSSAIASVLRSRKALHAVIGREDGNVVIEFVTPHGQRLIALGRHNLRFLDGMWTVTSIGGNKIEDDDANIFFDLDALRVHGNTGCNYFNGKITLTAGKANALSLSDMGVTRMACEKSSRETEMLVALEETTSCAPGDNNTAMLFDDTGRVVMTLRRVANSKDSEN